ncbi:MAG: aldo/keto reductase [Dehalococcoidales bacterium]|nr:aldo/keto reductase [Dehalococcoidales bacterium]
MKYRRFGKLNWEVSALGFGAMRLPTIDDNKSTIDEPEAIEMIRYAIDHGVNYLDTGYPYHQGNSEKLVGKALKDGYRDKIKLATKLPARFVESAQDFNRYFNEQLERLQMEKIDFYLLHGLNGQRWRMMRDFGILKWAEEKMEQGKFDYFGFSFHDDYQAFKEIVDAYDNWALAQIQYNYMDVYFQAGRRGIEYAVNKNLAIVVMEPLRGGRLSKQPPPSVGRILDTAPHKRTPAEWGLLWIWNQPEVSVTLSGMSTMEQVKENITTADNSVPGMLTSEELFLINEVRDAYNKLNPVPCTGCKYCMPCPNNVEIPQILQIYNEAIMYEDLPGGQLRYNNPDMLKEEFRADQCVECGVCLEACPQKISIIEWLKKAQELLKQ